MKLFPVAVGHVLARMRLCIFAALASVVMLVGSWFERHPLTFGSEPVVPDDAGRTQLIWTTILFAVSVLAGLNWTTTGGLCVDSPTSQWC
jgi:hypothetical protein